MSLRDDAVLLAGVAVVGFLAFNKFRNSLPSASEMANRYTSGVVHNADGSVNIAATVGATNPSGIPAATSTEAAVLRLASAYGVPIVYQYGVFSDTGTVDYAYTVRDIAYAAGITPAYGFFGGIDITGTVSLLLNLTTVPQS